MFNSFLKFNNLYEQSCVGFTSNKPLNTNSFFGLVRDFQTNRHNFFKLYSPLFGGSFFLFVILTFTTFLTLFFIVISLFSSFLALIFSTFFVESLILGEHTPAMYARTFLEFNYGTPTNYFRAELVFLLQKIGLLCLVIFEIFLFLTLISYREYNTEWNKTNKDANVQILTKRKESIHNLLNVFLDEDVILPVNSKFAQDALFQNYVTFDLEPTKVEVLINENKVFCLDDQNIKRSYLSTSKNHLDHILELPYTYDYNVENVYVTVFRGNPSPRASSSSLITLFKKVIGQNKEYNTFNKSMLITPFRRSSPKLDLRKSVICEGTRFSTENLVLSNIGNNISNMPFANPESKRVSEIDDLFFWLYNMVFGNIKEHFAIPFRFFAQNSFYSMLIYLLNYILPNSVANNNSNVFGNNVLSLLLKDKRDNKCLVDQDVLNKLRTPKNFDLQAVLTETQRCSNASLLYTLRSNLSSTYHSAFYKNTSSKVENSKLSSLTDSVFRLVSPADIMSAQERSSVKREEKLSFLLNDLVPSHTLTKLNNQLVLEDIIMESDSPFSVGKETKVTTHSTEKVSFLPLQMDMFADMFFKLASNFDNLSKDPNSYGVTHLKRRLLNSSFLDKSLAYFNVLDNLAVAQIEKKESLHITSNSLHLRASRFNYFLENSISQEVWVRLQLQKNYGDVLKLYKTTRPYIGLPLNQVLSSKTTNKSLVSALLPVNTSLFLCNTFSDFLVANIGNFIKTNFFICRDTFSSYLKNVLFMVSAGLDSSSNKRSYSGRYFAYALKTISFVELLVSILVLFPIVYWIIENNRLILSLGEVLGESSYSLSTGTLHDFGFGETEFYNFIGIVNISCTVLDLTAFQWGWEYFLLDGSVNSAVPYLYDGVFAYVDLDIDDLEENLSFILSPNLDEHLAFTTILLSTDTYLSFSSSSLLNVLLSSYDVIHNCALPSMGFKEDCTPGNNTRFNSLQSSITGRVSGLCSELCGDNHARMPINIQSY
jgi:hypothetical protein